MLKKRMISSNLNRIFTILLILFSFNLGIIIYGGGNDKFMYNYTNLITNSSQEKEGKKEDLIKILDKLYKMFFNIYNKEIEKYKEKYYFVGIKDKENEIIIKLENKSNLIKYILNSHKKKITDENKKELLEIINKINGLALENAKKQIKIYLDNLKSKKDTQLSCAYSVIRQGNFENKFKSVRGYYKKQKVLEEMRNKLFQICGINNIPVKSIQNDLNVDLDNIINDLDGLNLFVSKNLNIFNQKTILNSKVDLNKNPKIVKFSSLIGLRYLGKKRDYHPGIDITVSNLQADMKFNYNFIFSKKTTREITPKVKETWKTIFNKEYEELKNNKGNGYYNYKNNYKIYININNNFLKKYNCYLGKNNSRYSKRLVGFGIFLLCINKKENHAILFGHLDKSNLTFALKKGIITKINDPVKKFELGNILALQYQDHYYTFDKKTFKWNSKYQELFYGLSNSNNEYYKINKGLVLKYGTTGFSFGDHIHLGNIFIDNDYAGLILDKGKLEKILQKLFGTTKIDFTNNSFFFLSSL